MLLSEKLKKSFELLKNTRKCRICCSDNVITERQIQSGTLYFTCKDCGAKGYKDSGEESWEDKQGNCGYHEGS